MNILLIDAQNGAVCFPDGFPVDPGLTYDGFRAGPKYAIAAEDYENHPWINFYFPCGQIG